MYRDEWVADAGIQTENGLPWLLRYYIRVIAPESKIPVYGIKVEKYNNSGALEESETTPALTASKPEVSVLARRFANGTVTPMVLLEMVDEWVS